MVVLNIMRAAGLFAALSSLYATGPGGYEHARDLYNRTDYAGAIAGLEQGPRDARELQLLGQCYFMETDYRRATEVLEKAAALDPADSNSFLWLGRAYGRRAETSFAVSALGFAVKSRQNFEKAVKLDSRNLEAVNDLFEFYIQAPGIIGGGIEKARGLIPLIEKSNPAEAHFAGARIAEESKEFAEEEAHLRSAVELSPHQLGRILDLAKFLARQGRFEESDRTFERAERIAPNSPRILFAHAQTWIRSKRNLTEARALLKRYLAANNLTPDDPPRAEAARLLRKTEGG